jgi:multidrug efflux system membrane fusion protein
MVSKKQMRIKTFSLAGMLVFSALALSSCNQEKAEAAKPVIRPVKVVEVAQVSKVRKLEYSGAVKSRTEMNLGFRVAGKITERLVSIGDRVKKGDVLARLDPTDFQLAVQSSEASLNSAEKAVETAALTNRRTKTLFEKTAVPKSQVEQAQLAFDQAEATRVSAAASLDQARNQLAYAELKSDREGIVSAITADRGQVVAAGSAVLTVVADDEKEVEIAVPEGEIAKFQIGKAVKARFWSDDALVLPGTVREVSGSADAQSRTFSVRVSLPRSDRVLIGMTATVEADVAAKATGYNVPLSALAEQSGGKIVWTVDRAKATVHARPIEVSGFTADGVDVTKGLNPGDLVVAAGTQFMRENLTVKLPDVGQLAGDLLQ